MLSYGKMAEPEPIEERYIVVSPERNRSIRSFAEDLLYRGETPFKRFETELKRHPNFSSLLVYTEEEISANPELRDIKERADYILQIRSKDIFRKGPVVTLNDKNCRFVFRDGGHRWVYRDEEK